MHNEIKEKLEQIDYNIFYGLVPKGCEIEEWNYLVFGKKKLRKSGTSGIDLTDYYSVTIVRENYIPDDLVFKIIQAMRSIPGMRLSDDECNYEYTTKGNTNLVVEILSIYFTKAKKGEM